MGIKVKDLFFDRTAVLNAVGRAQARVLSAHGASMRSRAKRSMKRAPLGVASPAGTAPHRHKERGEKLWRHLYFSYVPDKQSVIAGPAKLSGVAGKDVPHVVEYGGMVRRVPDYPSKEERDEAMALGGEAREKYWELVREERRKKGDIIAIQPRPYMRPSLAAEVRQANLKKLWENAIKR